MNLLKNTQKVLKKDSKSERHLTQFHLTKTHTTQRHHNKTPSCHNTITIQHHHVTTASQHNTILSQHHPNERTLPPHYALFTKKQHEEFCNTTPPQHNSTTTQLHHNKTPFLKDFFPSSLYSTPPSMLHRMTWVSQSRFAFGHRRRVCWPWASGPFLITILTNGYHPP